MDSVPIEKIAHLQSEKIQIFLRILLVISIVVTLNFLDSNYFSIIGIFGLSVRDIFIVTLIFNISYYLLLLKYPYNYQIIRISLVVVLDIVASVYVMYLVGGVSLYYTFLLLWYMVGYGLRYTKSIAYIAYITILVSWTVLINTSDFWINHDTFAYSWLVTYTIIPLYYFHIVEELKLTLNHLHTDVEDSQYQATHDSLTQLPNRISFEKKLENLSQQKIKFALLFIDLDEFKAINDQHGHLIGDKVLKEFAQRMEKTLPYTARLGGDEFVSIIGYEDEERLRAKVEEVLNVIQSKCKSNKLVLSASIGVSLFPKDTQDTHILKKYSDEAMYTAKKRGKNTFVFYKDIVES